LITRSPSRNVAGTELDRPFLSAATGPAKIFFHAINLFSACSALRSFACLGHEIDRGKQLSYRFFLLIFW